MKKLRFLSLLLCAALLCQMAVPASAAETGASAQETQPAEQQAAQIPFGRVCIDNGCRTLNGMRPLAGSDSRLDTALAAFAYETNTETVIYSYNPDTKLPTGTLAKIVTALVAIENSNLDDIVTCSDGIQSKVPGSSLKMKPNLKSGEQLTVNDLLHALLMIGANDAAVALAEHVAGTTDRFKEMMNDRVKQMGCISTEFGNISGLDTATSYTTAREMVKITMEATKNETFAEIFKTGTYKIPATNLVSEERPLTTTNYLVDDHVITQFMSSRYTGGIASYTENSGASIVGTAEHNNMRVIFVVLGAARKTTEKGIVETYGNFEEITELANYVFNNYKVNRIIYDGMAVNQWPVSGGECQVVGQSFTDVDTVVPAGVQMKNYVMNYTVEGGGLTAPIKKDDKIATMEVWYQNSCVTEVELYAMADVRATGDTGVSIRSNGEKDGVGGSGVLSTIGTICVIGLGLGCVSGLQFLYALPHPRPAPPETGRTQEEPVTMLNWDGLKSVCADCTRCGLCETRHNVVFGVGKEDADIMFVGEGPGEQEDLKGQPFVGPAGKLLDDMLCIIDLSRETNCYIANIVKCRPPQNRDPKPTEQDACIGYLRNQVALVKPKIIVCLGRIAAKRLIDADYRITRQHGQWVERNGVWMTAIYHPSALLRDVSKRPETFDDLLAIRAKIREIGANM